MKVLLARFIETKVKSVDEEKTTLNIGDPEIQIPKELGFGYKTWDFFSKKKDGIDASKGHFFTGVRRFEAVISTTIFLL